MKLLLTSVAAVIDPRTEEPYKGILQAFDRFINMEKDNEVYVISSSGEGLEFIPKKYNPTKIRHAVRQANLITILVKNNPGFTRSSTIVLGAKDVDFHLAVNEKVLLLTANYAYRVESKVRQYGRPIQSPEKLISFFDHYLKIQNPWYFRIEVDERTTMVALTNANTYSASTNEVEMNNHFKDCLKDGKMRYQELFLNYFLMSVYSSDLVEEFRKVDYWSLYPSASPKINRDLHKFMEVLRILFKGKPKAMSGSDNTSKLLLQRDKETAKRHHLSSNTRITQGCDIQFDTLLVNSLYSKKTLTGKTICIIDDYTTYGTSCEAVRHIFETLGAARIIFVALGKYGKAYYKYNYRLNGDLTEKIEYKRLAGDQMLINYTLNVTANKTLIESLIDLL